MAVYIVAVVVLLIVVVVGIVMCVVADSRCRLYSSNRGIAYRRCSSNCRVLGYV